MAIWPSFCNHCCWDIMILRSFEKWFFPPPSGKHKRKWNWWQKQERILDIWHMLCYLNSCPFYNLLALNECGYVRKIGGTITLYINENIDLHECFLVLRIGISIYLNNDCDLKYSSESKGRKDNYNLLFQWKNE